MPIAAEDEDRVIRLLTHDVVATLGVGHEAEIRERAAWVRSYWNDPSTYGEKVVEEVQAHFHDCFVDTVWPRCPRHPNHPLWLHEGFWTCTQDRVGVSPLGALTLR